MNLKPLARAVAILLLLIVCSLLPCSAVLHKVAEKPYSEPRGDRGGWLPPAPWGWKPRRRSP
uniref:Predicted protein n=1 Tax=Hordeum vulgare subsp. vulgare TaxID=112509 RepID=F2DYW4_HORVV|nr:predicted protein [Hordeum vulgare subsp. vulgare]